MYRLRARADLAAEEIARVAARGGAELQLAMVVHCMPNFLSRIYFLVRARR